MDRKARLLVVEDDADLAQGLSVWLRAKGFEVLIAQDGLQALTAVRKEHPDLVLLDLGLPGGDGYTVLERMRGMVDGASVPVIVLRARDPVVNRDRAAERTS
ncbi:MAG: response regulator [Candidatus Eisenbacteria bacterium]|uniref:Response regulator n=1 Tax=Eiseniibacteriota bacterium TaxID=2212470 RepID=A0A849SQU0_UNCEI|nr:response regulator [Candidatus Eisenbacteria bacterium]